jgi:HlyD family secretion protein
MSGNWPNTDLREYQTEIFLTDNVERIRRLRPGLTSQVEILIDNRADVLQVPVQAVLTVADKQIAFVLVGEQPERKFVKTGQSNQSHLEILEGLQEGDRVIMNPRSQFGPEIAALEAELNAAKSKEDQKIDAKPRAGAGVAGPGGGGPGRPGGGEAQRSGPGGPGGAPGGQAGTPGGQRRDPAETIARNDKDGDGQLSLEELPERMRDRFSQLDKDGNGKISKEELAAGGSGGASGGGRPPQ